MLGRRRPRDAAGPRHTRRDTPSPDTEQAARLAQQREVLERLAVELEKRRLTAPTIFTLEMTRPLSFVASQAMVALGPIIQPIFSFRGYNVLCAAFEDRKNVDWLVERLERGGETADG
jgi:hypothetical protein